MKKITIYSLILLFLYNCNKQQVFPKIIFYDNSIENIEVINQDSMLSLNKNKIMDTLNIIKPSYNVYVRSRNAQFEILIDDVPAFKFFGKESAAGMGMNGNIPINQCLLKSGNHIIVGKLFPKYGSTKLDDGSFLTLESLLKESGTVDALQLFELKTPSDNENNKSILPLQGLPYFEMKREFDVKVPFDIEGWTDSINLKDEKEKATNNDLEKELQAAYNNVRAIIEKKDIQAFSELILEREKLHATAFYFNKQQQEKDLQNFLEIINNNDYELAPYPKEAILHFYGYGKLVSLFTKEKEGIIKLINKKDSKEEIILDFYFHKKRNSDKLEVIL